jgi:hypothetical protein
VFNFMCSISCVRFHVFDFMCSISCVRFHVFDFMCSKSYVPFLVFRSSKADLQRWEREAHPVHPGHGQLLHRVSVRRNWLQRQRHQSKIRKRTG